MLLQLHNLEAKDAARGNKVSQWVKVLACSEKVSGSSHRRSFCVKFA